MVTKSAAIADQDVVLAFAPNGVIALAAVEVVPTGAAVEEVTAGVTFHVAATGALWVALALTVVSAVDYFYRFFRKADYRAIVPEEDRWS